MEFRRHQVRGAVLEDSPLPVRVRDWPALPNLRRARRWRFLAGLAAALWLLSGSHVLAQSADEVAAAFIYNFSRFVEWPARTFSDGSAPVTVGFVGKTAMADIFEQNVKGKNANGRE